MKVVPHEYIGVDLQFESFDHLAERVKKSEAIFLIPEDFLLFISTGQHMIKSIRIVHSKGSGHKYIIRFIGFCQENQVAVYR